MRYIFLAVLAGMLLMLNGCSNTPVLYEITDHEADYVTGDDNTEVEYNYTASIHLAQDDADIYVINEYDFAMQIFGILFDPASFLERTIRFSGEFNIFNWEDELIYFVGADGDGCCGMHGFEVYLNDIPPVDEHTWVEVTGVLEEVYEEGMGYFLRLNLVSMIKMEE